MIHFIMIIDKQTIEFNLSFFTFLARISLLILFSFYKQISTNKQPLTVHAQ